MPGATRSIVINAPVERVFDVVTDYAHYPEFLTEAKKVTTSGRQGDEVLVHYEIELIKRIRYTIRVKETRPTKMEWTFVEGDVMKDNRGSWVLESLGAAQTRATYTAELALGALVPKAIVNTLVEGSLPKMLEAFKRRAEAGA